MKTLDYYLSLPYRMEIIPDMEEGGYTAKFPDLPGCLTCAETIEELVESASDAKKVWLTAALEDGIEIAEPGEDTDLLEYSGQFKLRMPNIQWRLFICYSAHRTAHLLVSPALLGD